MKSKALQKALTIGIALQNKFSDYSITIERGPMLDKIYFGYGIQIEDFYFVSCYTVKQINSATAKETATAIFKDFVNWIREVDNGRNKKSNAGYRNQRRKNN